MYSVPQAGERAELQERSVRVEQELDPLPSEQLPPSLVARDIALATTRPGQGQLLVDQLDRLQEGALVVPEDLGGRVDGSGEDGHADEGSALGASRLGDAGSHCPRRRGKNRRRDRASAPGRESASSPRRRGGSPW